MTMRYRAGQWEIDAGACHGIDPGEGSEQTRVGVCGSDPVREATIVRVRTGRSVVEPVGWTPAPDLSYPVVLTRVPVPPVPLTIDWSTLDGAATAARLVEALRGAGDAHPSPHVRTVDAGDPAGPAMLRVTTTADGLTIDAGHGLPVVTVDGLAGHGLRTAVDRIEHIARWLRIRRFGNPASRLYGGIQIELVETAPGERTAPADRAALPVDRRGRIVLRYRRNGNGWAAPSVFVRLRNLTNRPLYCALLDLTDGYRVNTELFPGDRIAARGMAAALHGEPVDFYLPPGRPPAPGAEVSDWLKVMVAEDRFSSEPFELPRLGEPVATGLRTSMAVTGVLDRLGLAVMTRDAGRQPAAAGDWTTAMLPVLTRVPSS
jgi:hypothetical protein